MYFQGNYKIVLKVYYAKKNKNTHNFHIIDLYNINKEKELIIWMKKKIYIEIK